MKRLLNLNTLSTLALAAALVGAANWGISTAKGQFDKSVRHDLAAASLLAKLQLDGERLRRFEKEAFIYVADDAKRNGYVKEHDAAYEALLVSLDKALMSGNRGFNDEERKQVLQWKHGAIYYYGQFSSLMRRAGSDSGAAVSSADAGRMTIEYNGQIAEAKNQFRVLLDGASKMREAKEGSSQHAANFIDQTFTRLSWLIIGLSIGGCIVLPIVARRHARARATAALTRIARHGATNAFSVQATPGSR